MLSDYILFVVYSSMPILLSADKARASIADLFEFSVLPMNE